MVVTEYQKRVHTLLLQIPAGKVTTYGLLSTALKSSPRAVGGALRCNPYAPRVPCHRVVASDGTLGGFKGEAEKNSSEKVKLLEGEGVELEMCEVKGKGAVRVKEFEGVLWADFNTEVL